jgi:proteasome lid subunit RPN8/RPN11
MNIKEIQLSRKITNQLLHLAQISPEQEVCGLIGSSNNIASSCYPIENTADQPETRFQLDAKQQINAISAMREKNETLFAIYHSHPTTPAFPSTTDIKLATYPEAVYLIISLNTKGVLEIRGFKIINESVEEITLSLLRN